MSYLYIDFHKEICSSLIEEPNEGAFTWLIEMLDPDSPRTAAAPRPVLVTLLASTRHGIDNLRTWFFVHGFPGDLIPELAFSTEIPAHELTHEFAPTLAHASSNPPDHG